MTSPYLFGQIVFDKDKFFPTSDWEIAFESNSTPIITIQKDSKIILSDGWLQAFRDYLILQPDISLDTLTCKIALAAYELGKKEASNEK